MEKVIYSGNNGLGIILNKNDKEEDFVVPTEIHLINKLIKPGEFTDLFGFYEKPIRYVGCMKNESKTLMVFHIGDRNDLFNGYKYYYCLYLIDNFRICNKYSHNSARDFNWVNGKWK